MAKAPTGDSIMAPDKMKPLLALSKREPVQAAIGLSSDGDGIILLDKKAKPKKVFSMLKASAAKAKIQLNTASLRFGRAEVDTDYDSGMVRFFINKDAPGNMRMKLVEVVKRIPYQKVEINVDPSLEEEPEEDVENHEADTAPPQQAQSEPDLDAAALTHELANLISQIASAAGDDAQRRANLAKLAADANGKVKAHELEAAVEAIAALREALGHAGGGTDASTAPDTEALRHELATLIGRIAAVAGSDAELRGKLAKLATDANAGLKGQDVAHAAELIAELREALDGAGSSGSAANKPAGDIQARWRAARATWQSANDEVGAQINDLATFLRASGDEELIGIAELGLNAVTAGYRTRMTAALMDLGDGDPAALRKGGTKVLGFAEKLQSQIDGDARVAACDTNEFGVKVSIRATLGTALEQITGVLQDATAPA